MTETKRGRPKKELREPLEVQLVQPKAKNPLEGKFPYWNEIDAIPKKRVKFRNLQTPGMNVEFDKGRTVIKANGARGTHMEKYKLDDEQEVELPQDIIDHLNSLVYPEAGMMKPRFMVTPVV